MSQFEYESDDQSEALNALIREMNEDDRCARSRSRRITIIACCFIFGGLAVILAVMLWGAWT